MKKILISVLIVLLLVLAYIVLSKGLDIGFIKISSLNSVKEKSIELDENLDKANEVCEQKYPAEVKGLEDAIEKLKNSKKNYENKKVYNEEKEEIGTLEIKTYAIHYLWTILGNYREDSGVQTITLDVKSTENADVYDLGFTLKGTYTSITDFIYEIENDEKLNFEIKNFSVASSLGNTTSVVKEETEEDKQVGNNILSGKKEENSQNETEENKQEENTVNNTTENSESKEEKTGTILQATFTVENIGITLE